MAFLQGLFIYDRFPVTRDIPVVAVNLPLGEARLRELLDKVMDAGIYAVSPSFVS